MHHQQYQWLCEVKIKYSQVARLSLIFLFINRFFLVKASCQVNRNTTENLRYEYPTLGSNMRT